MKVRKNLLLILTGVITGFCNGFFGGGGGMIVVPMLTLVLKLEEKQAHATAIAIILPTTIISAIVNIINKNFDLSVGIPTSIGVFVGGIIGALLLKKINNKTLVKIFSITMLIAGIKMLVF